MFGKMTGFILTGFTVALIFFDVDPTGVTLEGLALGQLLFTGIILIYCSK